MMKKTFKFAGVGARATPHNVLQAMEDIGYKFSIVGATLHSGAAQGADQAFEKGCDLAGIGTKQIFIPWNWYRGRVTDDYGVFVGANPATMEHALDHHPSPSSLKEAVVKLHARNSAILLGLRLTDPVDAVICWTPQGKVIGGTGQAIRVAKAHNIPVYNLALEKDRNDLQDLYTTLKER